MKKLTSLLTLLAAFVSVTAQTPNGSVASVRNIRQNLPPHTSSFNANFTQIYNKSVTGLNYVSGSIRTTTRPTWQPGTGFPTSITISGIPGTAKIDAAFLYAGVSYTEATAPATIMDTIKNPLGNVTTYTDSLIGTSTPVCWGEIGSATYRCLVNPSVSGNGNYSINISGLANPAWEVDGFTLFITYIDTAATYIGNIAMNDGAHEYSGSPHFDTTLGGFTGCSSPSTYAKAFVMAGDIQNNTGAYAISSLNGSVDTFFRDFWNLYTACTTVAANQTSARFIMDSANNSDCVLINMYGLYFQSCSVNTPTYCWIYNNGDTTHPGPCASATAPYICYVTADTSSHDEVVWQKTGIDTNIVDSIIIYRAITNTYYAKIGEVSVHGYTDFVDHSANSNVTSYIYLLGAKDSCGDSLSTGVYHQSVFLQTGVGMYGHINLSWNPYVGNYVDYYRILRDDSGMGHWQVIDSVPGLVNAWTDLTPPNNSGLRYMVNTGWNIACSPNLSYSNARMVATYMPNISYSNISLPYPSGVPQYFNNESISIYPNPVKDVLEVAISQKIDADITVTNVLGQQVYAGKISTGGGTTLEKIDMSGLPNGIYIFSLQSGSQKLEKKVIKM